MVDLTAVICSVVSAMGGATAGVITQRRLNRKQDSTLITGNYQTLFQELRDDINRLREEQSDERSQWAKERGELNKTIAGLTSKLHDKDIEVIELRAHVETLQSQIKP